MRPNLLDPLFASVASLSGVGPKLAQLLATLLGREDAEDARVVDLLFLAPHRLIDRRHQPGIAYAQQGSLVTITGRVDRHMPPPPGKNNMPYRIFLHDETGELALTFFRVKGQDADEVASYLNQHRIVVDAVSDVITLGAEQLRPVPQFHTGLAGEHLHSDMDLWERSDGQRQWLRCLKPANQRVGQYKAAASNTAINQTQPT